MNTDLSGEQNNSSLAEISRHAAILDHANLVSRGAGRPGLLDAWGLDYELRLAGVSEVVVLSGAFFSKEIRRFRQLGWKVVETAGKNSDPVILDYARRFVRRGFHLVLASGDGNLALDVVTEARRRHVKVSFWSLSKRLSWMIPACGCEVHTLDHLVTEPRANDFTWFAKRKREIAERRATSVLLH
jgi:hypothetical protein